MQRALRFTLSVCCMVLAAGFIGCGSKLPVPSERLPGKWHGEMIVYEETQAKMPPEIVTRLAQTQYDFEFRPDGTMALSGVESGQAYTSEGRWQALKQDGDLMTINRPSTVARKRTSISSSTGKTRSIFPLPPRFSSAPPNSARCVSHAFARNYFGTGSSSSGFGSKSVGVTQPAFS